METDFRPSRRLKKIAATKKPTQQTFKTPDEVAAKDQLDVPALLPIDPSDEAETYQELPQDPSKPKKTSWKNRLKPSWPPTKKQWSCYTLILVLLIGGGTSFALVGNKSTPKPVVSNVKKVVKVAAPTTVPSTLSGLPVAPALNNTPVTAIMVENSLDARPQSGLSQAMVVFEALAEGGITRFMALYQDTSPTSIGPIRSARPYYIQWALGFNAGYAHVGGSPQALSDIKSWGVRDLDQFSNSAAYHRVTTREAPHNVYTSIAALNQLESSKGYTSSSFTGFVRKADAPSKAPSATVVNLTMGGASYNVQYNYNAATNSYNRSEGGAPQMDANTNTQVSPKVVVAMVVPWTQGPADGIGAYYSEYANIGSGPVDVFQDGIETTGTWTKTSNTSQITFTEANGQPLKLDAGQTWITAVQTTSAIKSS